MAPEKWWLGDYVPFGGRPNFEYWTIEDMLDCGAQEDSVLHKSLDKLKTSALLLHVIHRYLIHLGMYTRTRN